MQRMITLVQISNREIIDCVKYGDNKAIFVKKEPTVYMNQFKASYFVLNFDNGEREVITKSAYLLRKFGSAYQSITSKITNFIQCSTLMLQNRNLLVMFPNGQVGLFDSNGIMQWNDMLDYNEAVVYGIAEDDGYFWSCCRDENCVIRYNCDNLKVDIRIGSKEANTFVKPDFISADDKYIYVCCNKNTVRKIDRQNFTVSDVLTYPNINGFYKFGKYSVICTNNGAFVDKD